MASGHVYRTQRPNTWLHRPSLRREDSPCRLGAVHKWARGHPSALGRCLLSEGVCCKTRFLSTAELSFEFRSSAYPTLPEHLASMLSLRWLTPTLRRTCYWSWWSAAEELNEPLQVLRGCGEQNFAFGAAQAHEAIAAFVRSKAPDTARVGLESGPTATWLWTELKRLGVPVICIDARHAKAVLKLQINKSDRNDAVGIARIMQTGWFKEVRVKDLDWSCGESLADEPSVAGEDQARSGEPDPWSAQESWPGDWSRQVQRLCCAGARTD